MYAFLSYCGIFQKKNDKGIDNNSVQRAQEQHWSQLWRKSTGGMKVHQW